MTTISSKRRRAGARVWLWVLGAALCAVAAALWRAPLSAGLWQALAPLSAALEGSRQAQLEAQLASTTAALADRDALYQENLALKAMLGRDASPARVLAGVIERPPATPYDTLVIDAGSVEGVAAGDWVAAGGGAIVGSVREVAAHTAQVELLSSPGAQYQGLLAAGGASVPVELTGQGGGSLVAELPAGVEVGVGELVSIEGVIEGVEGVVSGVSHKTGDSFVTIYLQLPANPQTLRYVEVWKSNGSN